MTYITHGNHKGARWFPRCCCQDCEVIRERFQRLANDESRWEAVQGNWVFPHNDPLSNLLENAPVFGTREDDVSPSIYIGVQELPDDNPDFYTITDVSMRELSLCHFVVDFDDSGEDFKYHSVEVLYNPNLAGGGENVITVSFWAYEGNTATQLGEDHYLNWEPADPGDWLRGKFTVCLNDDNLSISMADGTTGDIYDGEVFPTYNPDQQDAAPDFFFSEDITEKKGGKRAGFGHPALGTNTYMASTRWNSFELHIHENQKSGCPSCLACVCQGPPADEYDVTIDGFNDSADSCCNNCADLDGDFTLRYRPDLSTSGVCVWQYDGAYTPMWSCGFPGSSPCVALGGLDISFLRLTVKADTDELGNDICRWKFTAGNQDASNYFGASWGLTLNAVSCDCDLSSAEFDFGGAESGTAGETHSTGETILDPDGNPQSRNEPEARWFSEVCDVTSVTVTVSAA